MTNVYFFNVKELCDPEKYEKALSYLSSERLKKLEALKLPDDRARCAAAGYLLWRSLDTFGINAAQAEYHFGEFGKPYLSSGDIFFSLSHAGDAAMCAVSDKAEVGCDVEYKVTPKIAPRFFTPSELEVFQTSPSPDNTFLRIWTLKESFIKHSGKGLSTPLSSFEIILRTPPHCPAFPDLNFAEFELSDGYRGAVCTKDEINKEIKFISFE